MRRFFLSGLLALAAIGPGSVLAQMSREQAEKDARDLVDNKRKDPSFGPSDAKAGAVPGYAGTSLPQQSYYDNPEGLTPAGGAAAASSESFATVVDKNHSRAAFTDNDVLATTQRGNAIEKNPEPYTGGEAMNGSAGACHQLPQSSNPKGYYEETCNSGLKIVDKPDKCSGHIDAATVSTMRYFYWGIPAQWDQLYFAAPEPVMQAKVAAGVCRAEPTRIPTCDAAIMSGLGGNRPDSWKNGTCASQFGTTAQLYSCSSQLSPSEVPTARNWKTGTAYYEVQGSTSVVAKRNEGTCPAMLKDDVCEPTGPEVCVQGAETRTIDGIAVYQACWAWTRPLLCHRTEPQNNCSALEARPECHHSRDECLDDPQDGPCKVYQQVYSCPLGDKTPAAKQYVCGGDVYCLNGDCEAINRQPSTEFKDALVALHSLGDAGKQFDPNNLTVFSGERNTCHKKIFGAANCCAGKGVPLLTPALCDKAEKQLKERDDQGLCHEVGTYCSDKVIGVCVTSKKAFCCFGSKLSRILQEQGRVQIGKPWGKPKHATCQGFTIAEFQRLDLSRMDFSEVYAEFQDAAKVPSEVATMQAVQSRIQGYYALHGGK